MLKCFYIASFYLELMEIDSLKILPYAVMSSVRIDSLIDKALTSPVLIGLIKKNYHNSELLEIHKIADFIPYFYFKDLDLFLHFDTFFKNLF